MTLEFCVILSLSFAISCQRCERRNLGYTAKGRAMACFNEGKKVGKDLDLACIISSS